MESPGIGQRIYNKIPNMPIQNKRILNGLAWAGKNISSPGNRLILGVTALMSQPFIDLHNKKVDEDTRKVSALRTIAKIIAGTSTGVVIRWGCIKILDYCTKTEAGATKFQKLFLPNEKWTKELKNFDGLKQYKKSLGTLISLGVMVFTNFLIDAPLTKFLTNKFLEKKAAKEKLEGGQKCPS